MLESKSQIIQVEGQIKQQKFNLILTYIWATISLISIITYILLKIFWPSIVKNTGYQGGYGFLDIFIGVIFLLSFFTSLAFIITRHKDILALWTKIDELKAQGKAAAALNGSTQGQSNFLTYKQEVLETIEQYRKEAKHNRSIHNVFQWTILIGSILVTSFTSAVGFADVFKLFAIIASVLVSISAAGTGYYKFRERSFYLQQTADNIEMESEAFELGIRDYKGCKPEEAQICFAEQVQMLKEEQQKRQQQLEQQSENKQEQK